MTICHKVHTTRRINSERAWKKSSHSILVGIISCCLLLYSATWSLIISYFCDDILQEHLRLVNGSANYEGRLEVKEGDQWKTLCEDKWNKKSAQLVCSMLGYPGYV